MTMLNGTITRAEIVKETIVRNDPGKTIDANVVVFINNGQTLCMVDGQFPLRPGDILIERNVMHDYSFEFYALASPPAVSVPEVYSGNLLRIRRHLGPASNLDYIRNPNGVTASVTLDPYTQVNASETLGAQLTDFNIAAGKRKVIVKNISPLGGGDPLANATINGNPLIAGHPYEFEQYIDEVAKEVITSPALAIVTDGAYVHFQYYD